MNEAIHRKEVYILTPIEKQLFDLLNEKIDRLTQENHAQSIEIYGLKRTVKKLEKRNKSAEHGKEAKI